VSFDYPEAEVRDLTWLGDGPHGVYKNRLRGVTPDVWTKAYNNTAVGANGRQPPHANVCWAVLTTSEGAITAVSVEEGLFFRLLTPAVDANPQHAVAPFPAGGLSFLDAVPLSGTSSTPSVTWDRRARRTSWAGTIAVPPTSPSVDQVHRESNPSASVAEVLGRRSPTGQTGKSGTSVSSRQFTSAHTVLPTWPRVTPHRFANALTTIKPRPRISPSREIPMTGKSCRLPSSTSTRTDRFGNRHARTVHGGRPCS
jgi:hypothetical protein